MLFTRCRGLMETWLRHLLVIAGLMWAIPGLAAEQELFFESHVRPMLKAHCFHCHGEADTRESNLDLRLVHWIIRGGDNGPALTPAAADTSLLWQKIESGEMPPKGKGLSDSEKAILRKWIEQGARTRRPETDSLEAANAWTEEDRSYWAFQPPKRPTLPEPQQADLATSAIDRFLLAALEPVGLSLSPEADRSTLVRRVSFDLLGLPPTPELTAQFLSDESPDAYQRLVERLLASPAYGERWARHWLDTAGYADSDGYSEKDTVRPWAFRYRDYVIRSLNDSKPLDEWIVEQLAGDELLKPPYENLSPTDTDKLIATGFLRMAPDGTEDGGVEATLARNDVIAETIKIVSTSLLGLTVGCAQCHDHRYDPISQQDYYRFRAIFEPVFDTKNWRSKSARLVNIQSPSERQLAAQVDAELKVLEARQTDELDCIVEQIFDRELAKLPEDKQAAAMVARETKNSQRSPEQLQLLKDYPSLKVDRGSAYLYEAGRLKDFNKRWDELKAAKRAERPADQAVACATEVPGQVPTTYVFLRGDANQPKAAVEPGNLSILPATGTIPVDDDYVPTSGRRLALARNLTSGQHPLLTRVLVNRIWMHHFGAGLVNTPGDFGALGERPSHAELLDWLATELVQQNWDLKSLQRTILLSRAYRQQSIKTPQQQSIDPDNRLLSRMNIRRLEAETIRDAMIEVAGLRTMSMFGPPAPVNPDEVGQFIVGSATRDGNGIMVAKLQDDPEQYRRSIYVQVRRSMPLSMLEPFDLATLSPNCDRRSSSTVAPQSLLLMNNQVALTLAERFAQRLIRDVGDDPRLQIQRAWRLAYGFEASDSTVMRALEFMAVEREHFEKQAAEKTAQAPPKETAKDKKATGAEPAELPPGTQALALLCQAILSSNQFLYVD